MNAIVQFRKCTLTDDELLAKVDAGCDGMYEGPNAGRIPDRHIPARPDDDFDLLVGELILRYKEMKERMEKKSDPPLSFQEVEQMVLNQKK